MATLENRLKGRILNERESDKPHKIIVSNGLIYQIDANPPHLLNGQPVTFEPKIGRLNDNIATRICLDASEIPNGQLDGVISSFNRVDFYGYIIGSTRIGNNMDVFFHGLDFDENYIEFVQPGMPVSYAVISQKLKGKSVIALKAVNISLKFQYAGVIDNTHDEGGFILTDTDELVFFNEKNVRSDITPKYGMRVHLNAEQGANGKLYAKHVFIDPESNPPYYGIIIATARGKSIKDVIDKSIYHGNFLYTDGSLVTYRLKNNQPFNVQQVDNLPFGKFEGRIKKFSPSNGYGFLCVNGKEDEDIFFHQTNVLDLSVNNKTAIQSEMNAKFDIEVRNGKRQATRIMLIYE